MLENTSCEKNDRVHILTSKRRFNIVPTLKYDEICTNEPGET